jgi:RNA polymerase sigma-70 factor (ECF subfamily)
MQRLAPDPESRVASRELGALLERCIDQLPDGYRQVLVLRLVEGLDTDDTAAVLDLSAEAVKQRLHRARGMMQQSVEAELGATASSLFAFHADRCDRVVAGVLSQICR